jgi:hypothetical protein
MSSKQRYEEYLKSEYWQLVSKAVKARAGYRCQVCNSQHDLQAHHRTYEHRGRELEHLDDLTCLCRRCHAVFHGAGVNQEPVKKAKETKRPGRYEYDHDADMPEGDPIILTRALVDRLRTKAGAFTSASVDPLGVPKPWVKGWTSTLIGKAVSREVYRQCLEGREVYVR